MYSIDEGLVLEKKVYDCIDRCMRKIRGIDSPFGGAVLIIAGDCRQTMPVAPRQPKEVILQNSLFAAECWNSVVVLKLGANLRVSMESEENAEFSKFVDAVGDGSICEYGPGDNGGVGGVHMSERFPNREMQSRCSGAYIPYNKPRYIMR